MFWYLVNSEITEVHMTLMKSDWVSIVISTPNAVIQNNLSLEGPLGAQTLRDVY